VIGLLIAASFAPALHAQGRGRGPAAAPTTARGSSLHRSHRLLGGVRHRRLALPDDHAAEGDYGRVPLSPRDARWPTVGIRQADKGSGQRVQGRLAPPTSCACPGACHITWQDDATLKVEADAGTQTRTLRFASPAGRASRARRALVAGQPPLQRGTPPPNRSTSSPRNLRAGYLRFNGVPYSENATLTKDFDVAPLPAGGTAAGDHHDRGRSAVPCSGGSW
jgi:hypothetical protein